MWLSPFRWLGRFFNLLSTLILLATIGLLVSLVVFGFGFWYKQKTKEAPQRWGLIWTAEANAEVDLQNTDLEAIVAQIPFQRLQLISPWSVIEKENGVYDFQTLIAQMQVAQNYNLQVSLQLGLHQSGSGCYLPTWAQQLSYQDLIQELKDFIKEVISVLDNYHHLVEYQLEAEVFSDLGSSCLKKIKPESLADLYHFSRRLTEKRVALSQAKNFVSWRSHSLKPDLIGLSLTPHPIQNSWWQETLTFNTPSYYYSFIAGNLQNLNPESEIFIRQFNLLSNTPSTENQDLDANQVRRRLSYAQKTGLKTVDLHQVEYCYLMFLNQKPTCWQSLQDFMTN